MKKLITSICLFTCSFNIFCQTLLDKSNWQLDFVDEFDYPTSQLNTNWILGNGPSYPPTPGNNNNNVFWDPINAYNDAQGFLHLKISDRRSNPMYYSNYPGVPYNFSGAQLKSKYLEQSCTYQSPGSTGGFFYGMTEIRCKMAKGNGMYSAFWQSGHESWPPEIDIFEYNGTFSKEYFSTNHWSTDNYCANNINCTSTLTLSAGIKSLTLPTGWSIEQDQELLIKNDANNYMIGKVITYSPQTGACTVTVSSNSTDCTYETGCNNSGTCSIKGSGTYNSWKITCKSGNCGCSTFFDRLKNNGLDNEFHTYTLIWTPTDISWFFDGKETRTDKQIDRVTKQCLWNRMDMIIDLTLNWSDLTGINNEFIIDYVKYYRPTSNNINWNYKQNNKQSIDNSSVILNNNSPANVANSKISIVPNGNNIFYRGTDFRFWNYWWNGINMVESCVNWNVTDVSEDITFESLTNRTYYRSTNNSLKYFLNSNPFATGYTNCAGYLVTDATGKVFYKGTDNKVWTYYQVSGTTWNSAPLNNNANVSGGILVSPNAQDVFYRGTDNNIWKISWNGTTWNASSKITNSNNVTSYIVFDNSNNKIYYRASDNKIWNLYYNGSTWVNVPLVWNNETLNCKGELAYDNIRGILYYRGIDNKLWYYFNDKGWLNGGGNWYVCPMSWNVTNVGGSIAVNEQYGTVYYRGTDSKMYACYWKNGELLNLSCNLPQSNNYNIYRKATEVEDNESIKNEKITLFPNPSDGLITLHMNGFKNTTYLTVNLYNSQNVFIYKLISERHINNEFFQESFDLNKYPSGIYFIEIVKENSVNRKKIVLN